MYDIIEFWVINQGGLPLFYYSPKENLDPSLVGGFFSAIQNFARELEGEADEEEYIRSISFGGHNYVFHLNKELSLFFIAKSPKKIKIKKIDKHLKNLVRLFIQDYREKIIDFNGNTKQFEGFLTIIERYFEDNFVKLKGMW